jgi:hypothetical protein
MVAGEEVLHEVTKSKKTNSPFNPILHTAWLNNHALTLKRNTTK